MLQGANILEFFTSLELRFWNFVDIKDYCVVFQNSKVPPFIFLHITAETAGTVQLYNALNDEAVGSAHALTITDIVGSTYKTISFAGATIANQHDCYYYLKVTIGTDIFYSEVFSWETTLTDYFKIKVTSANVTYMGTYELPYSTIVPEFYLQYNGVEFNSKINEEGVEKPYGDIPIYNMLTLERTAEINGTSQVFRFLAALRIFEVNGTIEVTFNGVARNIYDIKLEAKDKENFGEEILMALTYKETDYISARNEI